MRIETAHVQIDLDERAGIGPRGPFSLSANEVSILRVLAEHPGTTVRRDALAALALGYAPQTVSRAIDAAISRLRTKLEVDPTTPALLETVYGSGYRLTLASEPARDQPAAAPDDDPLVERIGAAPLAQLVGPPGVGKTHVARRWAAAGGAHVHVALDPSRAAELSVLAALGATGDAALGRVTRLSARRVVLDDADGVAGVSAAAAALTRAGAQVLVVARRPQLDGAPTVVWPGLDPEAGVRLLREVREGLGDRSDHPALPALVRALAGNPRALQFVGRLSTLMDPAEIVRGLPTGATALHGDLAEGVERWAWGMLTATDRRLVEALLSFPGDFDRASAQAAVDTLPPSAVVDRMVDLVRRGVLLHRDGRYEVYPLLKWARPQAVSEGWRRWFAGLARELAAAAPTLDVMDRAAAHDADLRRGLDDALERSDAPVIDDAGWVRLRSGERSGAPTDLLALCDRLLAARPDQPVFRVTRAALLFNLGRRDRGRADADAAAADVAAPCHPFALAVQALIAHVAGDAPEAAVERLAAAVARGEDPWWTARAACALGTLQRLRGEPSRQAFDAAVSRWAWLEDTVGESTGWDEAAIARVADGDAAGALAASDRAAALRARCGTWSEWPNAHFRRGIVLHAVGRAADAERVLRYGMEQNEAAGRPADAYRSELAWVLTELDRRGEARALLIDAHRDWTASGHRVNQAAVAGYLAVLDALDGRLDDAWGWLGDAVDVDAPPYRFGAALRPLLALALGRATAPPPDPVTLDERYLAALVDALRAGGPLPAPHASALARIAARLAAQLRGQPPA